MIQLFFWAYRVCDLQCWLGWVWVGAVLCDVWLRGAMMMEGVSSAQTVASWYMDTGKYLVTKKKYLNKAAAVRLQFYMTDVAPVTASVGSFSGGKITLSVPHKLLWANIYVLPSLGWNRAVTLVNMSTASGRRSKWENGDQGKIIIIIIIPVYDTLQLYLREIMKRAFS